MGFGFPSFKVDLSVQGDRVDVVAFACEKKKGEVLDLSLVLVNSQSKHGKLHRLLGGLYDHLGVVLPNLKKAAEVEHLDLRLGLAPLCFRL